MVKKNNMELKLNLQIENLFGGDGNIRYIEERQVKFIRSKSKKTTKQNTGVSSENSVGEEQSEILKKEVQTFKLDDKGNPTYRFGGVHGKLWGHLRACGKMLADLGELDSKAGVDRMMMSVNITPINVSITNHKKLDITEIPQLTNGISKALIIQKFDYITECQIEMKLKFPDMYKEQVLKILKQSEETAGMNKRRATMKILNRAEVFK